MVGFFPKILHITYVSHAMHLICKLIRDLHPTTNRFISAVKGIFKKSPSRTQLWKNTHPTLPLPPQPVVTRCGPWIEAAIFYAEHLDQEKTILHMMQLLSE